MNSRQTRGQWSAVCFGSDHENSSGWRYFVNWSETVNYRQSVEIAAVVSAFSRHVIDERHALPPGALERFWDRSQRRLKLWLSAISLYHRQRAKVPADDSLQIWNDLEPVLEDIFVSEILTRVWGAVLTAKDQVSGTQQSEAIARNVLIGHLDARKRALQLLVTDDALNVSHLSHIDRIRRRVERWNDLLLGHLVQQHQVNDFAFDSIRAREFGSQQLLQQQERPGDQSWVLLLIGLRMAFPAGPATPPHELLQEEIIASILACFPPTAFPSDGPFQPILKGRVIPSSTPAPTLTQSSPNPISFLKIRNRMPPE